MAGNLLKAHNTFSHISNMTEFWVSLKPQFVRHLPLYFGTFFNEEYQQDGEALQTGHISQEKHAPSREILRVDADS